MFQPSPPTRLYLILTVAVVVALSACMPSGYAIAHPHKQLKQQIEELEQQWRAATLAGDTSTMDRMLSDDYVGISWNGEVSTKAMQLDRIRSRTFTVSRLDLSDSRIKLLGSVAIVTARAEVEGTNEGANIAGTFRYTRVYQRLPSGLWKITNFEVTRAPAASERHHHEAVPSPSPASPSL